jgi:molybdopterin-binding protein
MSNLLATVKNIQSCDTLHIVEFESNSQKLSMMSLDLDDKIKIGTKLKLKLKPALVAIGKNFSGDISYSNQLKTTIISIENGKLLTNIKLRFYDSTIESIITLASSKRMKLNKGDEVIAFIKASELSIGEIIYD